ncbi:MAG: protein kinase, partial [Pyrinomonadaceae bacterium]
LVCSPKNMPATNELLQEGRYRINQPSTPNGEEKIFEAYDTVRNTNVMVREIPVKLNKVATVSQRESLKVAFANQAKALTEIEHESLLHIHDYFSEIDRQYLVTEPVEGDNLGKLLASGQRRFSVTEVTGWADELLDALHYLHSRRPSIIHRNINPSNVTLHPSGKIKLIGVGVETGSDSEFAGSGDSDKLHYSPMEQIWPGLDSASQKAITNNYDDRSERILGQPLDERSDIYSLGATLYFLMTGVEPVDPIERSIEMLDGKMDPLREPTKVDSKIHPEISDVLMKALEIKRENRYDSAVIMRQVLKTAITRIQEREAESTEVQTEAAEISQQPSSTNELAAAALKEKAAEAEIAAKRLQAEADEKRRAAEAEEKHLQAAEQQKQNELMQRQLREAEEQRVLAERNAEADRLMRESEESSRAEAAEVQVPDDDLLDIPVAAEVVAYRDTAAVEEDELAAVLRELDQADAENADSAGRNASARLKSSLDDVIVFDSPLDLGTQESTDSHEVDDDDEIFTVPERTGFSMPGPAIAGAVALVVVIVVGGWFAMSGSSEAVKPDSVPTVQVMQPVEEPQPAVTIATSQSDTNSITSEVPIEQASMAPKVAATPKPKKETAKANPDKKKVTVDDLINDN